VATSAPKLTPSSWNCTPPTPTLSVAVAVTVTVPVTVAPAVGAVMETVGGVVSLGGDEGLRVCSAKVAVSAVAAFIVRLQGPVPAQPPLQPAKVEPAAGAAVRVTRVPVVKEVEQVVPQLMPAGELVTVPPPAPDLDAASAKDCCMKAAVTEVAAVIVTVQEAVPVQPPPLQPVKVEPAAGAAVRVTTVPVVKEVEQVALQLIPAGELVTVPLPAPALDTVSANDCCIKVAVTAVAAFIVRVQGPVPAQPPLQPLKVEPAAGAAVSETSVPLANEAEQVAPQEMPAGLLVTVPVPAPAWETVSREAVDTPVPVTSDERVSPSAVKLILELATAVVVGVKRTVTAWVAPAPTRVKGLPETMLKGAETEAMPVTVPPRVFWTVKT